MFSCEIQTNCVRLGISKHQLSRTSAFSQTSLSSFIAAQEPGSSLWISGSATYKHFVVVVSRFTALRPALMSTIMGQASRLKYVPRRRRLYRGIPWEGAYMLLSDNGVQEICIDPQRTQCLGFGPSRRLARPALHSCTKTHSCCSQQPWRRVSQGYYKPCWQIWTEPKLFFV